MKSLILPPLVLTLICTLICAALVGAHELTKDKIAETAQAKFNTTLSEVLGEGEYTELENNLGVPEIKKIIKKDDGQLAFEIVVSGYSKNGLDLIIGVNDNGITGIGVVAVTETKNVGTKVTEPELLGLMNGYNGEECAFDKVSSATYTSNALKNAAKIAVDAYKGITQS